MATEREIIPMITKDEWKVINMTARWRARYLDLAKYWSKYSKDPRKQCGAVVTDNQYVRGLGYNGFPRGVADTTSRLMNKDLKNTIMVHAEVNAIAAAQGRGDTIYVWPQLPCPQCLGTIIQNQIKIVVSVYKDNSSWDPEFSKTLATEAGLSVILYSDSEILELLQS